MSLRADCLKKALVERGYLPAGSWKLAMVEPVADTITKNGNPDTLASRIIDNIADSVPPELAAQGDTGVGMFFSQFGYEHQKKTLLDAVTKLNNS